ncbi:phage tail protein [Brevibacillus reuszeri]|uniref:phage tail protein n=1 Tax=Brevibacillus reuszeri TaxID=54915 RepID=UPI000CCC40D9|nr:phage tail protein [Brevibacillus reuszeri]
MAQTANLGLPLIDANMTADVPRDMNALAEAVDTAVTEAVEGVTVPDATTTQKGVVQLNDTTTSTNKTQAGTADAVRRAYERGSEGVTAAAAAQAKADAAETPAGAQAKANTAETNAKNASLPRTGGTVTGTIVFTTELPSITKVSGKKSWVHHHSSATGGYYIAPSITDGGEDFDYSKGLHVFEDDVKWAGGSLNDLKSSVANGKQAIATAISGKGVPASGSDEFAVLANKVSQINTGKKYFYQTYSGETTVNVNVGFEWRVVYVVSSASAGGFNIYVKNPVYRTYETRPGGSYSPQLSQATNTGFTMGIFSGGGTYHVMAYQV